MIEWASAFVDILVIIWMLAIPVCFIVANALCALNDNKAWQGGGLLLTVLGLYVLGIILMWCFVYHYCVLLFRDWGWI